MQRYLITALVGISLCLAAGSTGSTWAQAPPACPVSDVRAAVSAACPCDAKNHGQYMKCVRKKVNELRKNGCNVAKVIRCAAMSICGRPHSPIVCCKHNKRAKLAAADKCTARRGTVMSGVTSLCDVSCPAPSVP